ncbi:MAG: hypothetical protein HY516_00585 [Candidatus Aenigmarchaeota archaeon]|nr:hypothetical protein [Candidatus Aenigmarchaeota archaeon]
MSSFISENFLKIASLVLTIVALLGSIVQFQDFSLQAHGNQIDRLNLMFGQYLAGAPFLTQSEPDYRKGVLDADKLDKLDATTFGQQFDFQIKKYYLQINLTDNSRTWEFGDVSIRKENYKLWEYPVAVNVSDAVLAGKMSVYVPRYD